MHHHHARPGIHRAQLRLAVSLFEDGISYTCAAANTNYDHIPEHA